jgi:hypothetical protein
MCLGESFEQTFAVRQIKPLWYFQADFGHLCAFLQSPTYKYHVKVKDAKRAKTRKKAKHLACFKHPLGMLLDAPEPIVFCCLFRHGWVCVSPLRVACLLFAVRQIIRWQRFSLHQPSIGTTGAAGFHLKRSSLQVGDDKTIMA